jgi:hypothetical protein
MPGDHRVRTGPVRTPPLTSGEEEMKTYAGLADRIDRELSAGPFGDAHGLLRDKELYYTGVAWAHSMEAPPPWNDPAGGGFDPLPSSFGRSALDMVRQPPVPFRTLSDFPLSDRGSHHRTRARSVVRRRAAEGDPGLLVDWTADPAPSAVLRVAREVLAHSGFTGAIDPHTPSSGEAAAVDTGLSTAHALLPAVAATTFPFVSTVLVLRCTIPSMHAVQLPEMIMVGRELLARPSPVVGEALLHESLHEKWNIARLTRRLMADGYTDAASPRVYLPWSPSDGGRRNFNAARLLSTLHVYAHLAAYYVAALGAASPSAPETAELARRAQRNFERAAFLESALRFERVDGQLGPDGRAMRDWLASVCLRPVQDTPGELSLDWRPFPVPDMTEQELVTA